MDYPKLMKAQSQPQTTIFVRAVVIAAPAAAMAACKAISVVAKIVYVKFGVGSYLPLLSEVLVSFPVFIAIAASVVAVAFIAIPERMLLAAVVALMELALVVCMFRYWW